MENEKEREGERERERNKKNSKRYSTSPYKLAINFKYNRISGSIGMHDKSKSFCKEKTKCVVILSSLQQKSSTKNSSKTVQSLEKTLG